MSRLDKRDVILSFLLVLIGIVGLGAASPLQAGELARMGPGFLPRVISWILVGIGAAVALRAIFRSGAGAVQDPVPWRGLLYVGAGILSFALLVRPGGLILASFFLVVLCCSAELGSRWREKLLLAAGFTVVAALIFVIGLGLPLSLYPALS